MNGENENITTPITKNETFRNKAIRSPVQLSDFINAVLKGNPVVLSSSIIDFLVGLARENSLPLPPTDRNYHSIFMRPVRKEGIKNSPEAPESDPICKYRMDIFDLGSPKRAGACNIILHSKGRGKFKQDQNKDIIVTYEPYKKNGKALRLLMGEPKLHSSNRIKTRPTERLIQAQEKYPNRGVYPIHNPAQENSGIPSTALIMPFYPFSIEDKLNELSPPQRLEVASWLPICGQELFKTNILHGDIKPQNIMLTTFAPSIPLSDKLRLIDWDDSSYINPQQSDLFDNRFIKCGTSLYQFFLLRESDIKIRKSFIFYHDFHSILFSVWEILLPAEFKTFEQVLKNIEIRWKLDSREFFVARVKNAIKILNNPALVEGQNSPSFITIAQNFRAHLLSHLQIICPNDIEIEKGFDFEVITLDNIVKWYENFIELVQLLEQSLATLEINEISFQTQASPR